MQKNMSEQKNYFDITGRVVIITGGLGQLGQQFSKTLLVAGARVVVLDLIDEENFKNDSKFAYLKHNSALYLKADVTNKKSLEYALTKVIEKWGCPFGLINNAAIDSPPDASSEDNGPFEDYPERNLDNILNVNVKGVINSCQIFGGAMKNNGGSIINICSIYGVVSPNQNLYEYRRKKGDVFYKPVGYSVSKSALLNLSRYLSTYWAKDNIRVNTLTFGGVYNNQDDDFLKAYCEHVPLGRMAREDEYNGAILFLLSDASSYMTGSNVIIDGGWTAW